MTKDIDSLVDTGLRDRSAEKGGAAHTKRNICVFCGSSAGDPPIYREQAVALGRAIAERGMGLVYGGGHVGIMGIVADSVLERGGEVHGVIPRALADRELAHQGLTTLKVVETMHERKKLMFDLSDAFLALPGGFGTLDETFEIITWRQIGIHDKPLVLVNVDGYFDHLVSFVGKAAVDGFIPDKYRRLFITANSVDEALKTVEKAWAQPIG